MNSTGNAYLAINANWKSLAGLVKAGVEEGFNAAFFVKGRQYLSLKLVSPAQMPTRLNFVDVVIRLGSTKAESLKLFNSHAWQQLSQALLHFSTTPQQFRAKPYTATKVDVGVAVALKDPNCLPPVCISEGIVSLVSVWRYWKFFRTGGVHGKGGPPGPVGSKLSRKEQKSFGVSLGRCLAHEAWHQIILTPWGLPPYGNDHPTSSDKRGLECDECGYDWWKDKASFGSAGEKIIVRTMPLLKRKQGSTQTLELFRGISD